MLFRELLGSINIVQFLIYVNAISTLSAFNLLISSFSYYCPQTKLREGNVFPSVCPSTGGGGGMSSRVGGVGYVQGEGVGLPGITTPTLLTWDLGYPHPQPVLTPSDCHQNMYGREVGSTGMLSCLWLFPFTETPNIFVTLDDVGSLCTFTGCCQAPNHFRLFPQHLLT